MSDTTRGAKYALSNDAEAETKAAFTALEQGRGRLTSFGYVVVLGRDSDGLAYVANDEGKTTCLLHAARTFDTWADAMRFALDECDIPDPPCPCPRGRERPDFPRVCYARVFEEVTEC